MLSLEEPTDDPHNELSEESRMDPAMSSPEPHSLSKDVGSLLDPALSIESICQAMEDLPNEDKYDYLNNQVKPPAILPTTCIHGINLKFNASWIKKYPWLVYSPRLDGVFCGPCSLLLPVAQRKDKGLLVNRPFSVWSKLSTTLSGHSSLCYHRDCMQSAEILHSTIKNPSSCIHVMTNHILQSQISENKQITCQIVRAVIFLAKQGLPFHGDVERVQTNKNPGNFLALLKDYAATDDVLFKHLNSLRAKMPPISLLSHRMTLLISLGMI